MTDEDSGDDVDKQHTMMAAGLMMMAAGEMNDGQQWRRVTMMAAGAMNNAQRSMMAAGVTIVVGVMMGINEYDGIKCKCDDAGSAVAAG